ncbi:hypothetical protein [Nocardia fluminea]|uniref:hypothetical protein n=1 Tax=Nocardia fluminea TaxID=134984 RepID=UPI003D0FB944
MGALTDRSYGVREFLVTDPGGNTIQIAQPISADQRHRPLPKATFDRAIHMGSLFADSMARELLAQARGAGIDGQELADERRRVAELEAGLA